MNTASSFSRYLSNTAWMVGGRLVKSLIAFAVTVFVARYLGPDRFGALNYAMGITLLFSIFCAMGLDNIMVRELVGERDREKLLLGSSLVLRSLGTIVAIACTFLLLLVTHADRETWILTMICSLSYFFRAADVLRNFYEASVQARTIVIVETIQSLISSALRIYFIAVQGSVIWFAWCWISEWVLIAMGFLIHYSGRHGGFKSWRCDLSTLIHLTRESMPMLLSAMAIVVYQQIDRIMLRNMLGENGNEQVGFYSAALRVIPFAILIPQMMSKALAPSVMESKKTRDANYEIKFQLFNDLITWTGVGLSISLYVLAKPIMHLFGSEYSYSIYLLKIISWKGLLMSMSVASGIWIVTEGLQKGVMLRNLAGCAVNIVLNYLWIPRWGAVGSACATVISYTTASCLIHAVIPTYKPIFIIQLRSLTGGLWRIGKYLSSRSSPWK